MAGMTDSANTLPTQVHAFGTANGYFDPEREDLYGAFPLNNPEIKDMADETLAGLYKHVYAVGTKNNGQMTATIFLLGRHLLNTHSRYTFERESGYSPADLQEFAEWATSTNSIFVFPDGSMYNAHGVDLLAKGTPANAVPIHPVAAQRAAQIRSKLTERGIEVTENLPPVFSEFELLLPAPHAVRERMLAAISIGEIATGATLGMMKQEEGAGEAVVRDILSQTKLERDSLTDMEREFIEELEKLPRTVDGELEPIEVTIQQDEKLKTSAAQLSWASSAGEVLAWVLGYDDLAIMDPDDNPGEDFGEFLINITKKSPEELEIRDPSLLCSAWEQIMGIRWFVVDQSLKEDSAHKFSDQQQSTLYERHRAFSWLASNHAFFDEPWHEADLST